MDLLPLFALLLLAAYVRYFYGTSVDYMRFIIGSALAVRILLATGWLVLFIAVFIPKRLRQLHRLPWFTFLVLPCYALVIHTMLVLCSLGATAASRNVGAITLSLAGAMAITFLATVAAWLFCALRYAFSKAKDRDNFCWIPLAGFIVHLCCFALLFVSDTFNL